jgi:hypothetical protein
MNELINGDEFQIGSCMLASRLKAILTGNRSQLQSKLYYSGTKPNMIIIMCLPPVGRPVGLPFTLIAFSVHNEIITHHARLT